MDGITGAEGAGYDPARWVFAELNRNHEVFARVMEEGVDSPLATTMVRFYVR